MKYQVMPDLTSAEYETLKADIAENGIRVPVEVDETGDILDGHHRVRAWKELSAEGVVLPDYPRMVRVGMTEEQKRNHARALNVLRRHLTGEQRDDVIRAMYADGQSQNEIADTVGVHQATVSRVLNDDSVFAKYANAYFAKTEKIKELALDGKSPEEIAQAVGVHRTTVDRKLSADPDFAEAEDKRVGKDGKMYPTKKPRQPGPTAQPTIFAATAKDEKQARKLAAKIQETDESVVTVKEAATRVKKSKQQKRHDRPDGSTEASQTTNTISVQEWEDADDTQRSSWLALRSDNKFNETNDNIEWASWSWNPVTGCLHDCPYCYARDIATRFYPQKFTPSFLPDRLNAPANTNVPSLSEIDDLELRMAKRNVFVCSMADLFGKWVPTAWIDSVLQQAWDNPQWTFLFLTKFPVRMAEFQFPKNSWIGTTVDRQYAVDRAEKAFTKIRKGGYEGIAWLSCEPMMERLTFSSLNMFDWVIMGGSSKSTQTPEHIPPFEWTVHLWNQAKALDLPVFMKTNLGIEQSIRVREYPKEMQ